jgi:hypothetical protein
VTTLFDGDGDVRGIEATLEEHRGRYPVDHRHG